MGKRKASIETLLTSCDADLTRIQGEYSDSLRQRHVWADLQGGVPDNNRVRRTALRAAAEPER